MVRNGGGFRHVTWKDIDMYPASHTYRYTIQLTNHKNIAIMRTHECYDVIFKPPVFDVSIK